MAKDKDLLILEEASSVSPKEYDHAGRMRDLREARKKLGVVTATINVPETMKAYLIGMGAMFTGLHYFSLIASQDEDVLYSLSETIPRINWKEDELALIENVSDVEHEAINFLYNVIRTKHLCQHNAKTAAASKDAIRAAYWYAYEYALTTYARGVYSCMTLRRENEALQALPFSIETSFTDVPVEQ